jgi:hypothetical protein
MEDAKKCARIYCESKDKEEEYFKNIADYDEATFELTLK